MLASGTATTTILFTDIEGSSDLVEALGDRRWLDLLRLHNALVREQIERHRGYEVKTVGDGFMVAFSSADAAVACATDIQRALAEFNAGSRAPPLRVRIGAHTGSALRDEDDYFGREVNMAARVSAAAAGGEVLVSDAVRARLSTPVAFAPASTQHLKGMRGRHRLHPVVWDAGALPETPVVRALSTTSLYERRAEVTMLGGLLEDAMAGAGRTAVVEGPVGVGKTSLLDALAQRAREEDVRVLRAQASEMERAIPLGVTRALLEATVRRMSPAGRTELADGPALRALGIEPHTGPDTPHDAVMAALYRLLVSFTHDSPSLIIVDDAQWSDDATLAWLGYASRRIGGLPVMLVLGLRRDGRPLPEELERVVAGDVVRIAPSALSPAGVERIVREREPAASRAFVTACARISGGLPLHVRELLAAARTSGLGIDAEGARRLADVTTASVARLVTSRLEALGLDELALARACATLDTRADLRSAGTLAELTPQAALAAADALCDAGLLEPVRPLRFAHPTMHAAVVATMTVGARSALHAAAAAMLAADGAPPQEIGAHLLAVLPAGDPTVPARLGAAAAAALAGGAPGPAGRFLERALEEPPPAADLPGLLSALAGARLLEGRCTEAVRHAERALALQDEPAARAATLSTLARAVEREMLRPDADADFEQDGLRVVELIDATVAQLGPGERAMRFELEALAVSLTSQRYSMQSIAVPPDEAARLDRLAAAATGDSAGEHELLGIVACRHLQAGSRAAAEIVALARRAVADGAVVREFGAGAPWGAPLEALMMCDAHAEAERHLAAAARHARRRGAPAAAAYCAVYRAVNAWLAGALDASDTFHGDAMEHLAEIEPDAYLDAVAGGAICGVLLARADLHAAAARAGALDHPRLRDNALGLVLAARGDAAGAAEHLRSAQLVLDRRGLWRTLGPLRPVRPDLAVALAASGELEAARRVADAELEVARRFGAASCQAEALRAQAAACGTPDPLREAARIVESCEARIVEAGIQIALGEATAGAESARALRRGAAIAERAGASALVARAHGGLAALDA